VVTTIVVKVHAQTNPRAAEVATIVERAVAGALPQPWQLISCKTDTGTPTRRGRLANAGNIVKALRFLRDSTAESPADWKVIVERVKALVDISDWMTVRNVMQRLVNNGALKRVPDVRREAYYATSAEKFDAYTR
jgi:hypothetical protein